MATPRAASEEEDSGDQPPGEFIAFLRGSPGGELVGVFQQFLDNNKERFTNLEDEIAQQILLWTSGHSGIYESIAKQNLIKITRAELRRLIKEEMDVEDSEEDILPDVDQDIDPEILKALEKIIKKQDLPDQSGPQKV